MAKKITVPRFQCEHCDKHFKTEDEAKQHEEFCGLIEKFIKQGDLLFVPTGPLSSKFPNQNALFSGPIHDLSTIPSISYTLVEVVAIKVKSNIPENKFGVWIQFKIPQLTGLYSECFTDYDPAPTRDVLINILTSFLVRGIYDSGNYSFYGKKALTDEQISEIKKQIRKIERNAHQVYRKL